MSARETMTSADAAWLHMDRPDNLMVVNAVLWFDEPVDWEAAAAAVEERLVGVFPRFRQRVVDPPVTVGPLVRPAWEEVQDFDVRDHLRRGRLHGDDREAALHAYVGEQVSVPLPFDRPLWEAHLLDGYGDGSAILLRTHHAIADGIALVQCLLRVADPPQDGERPGVLPLAVGDPPASPLRRVAGAAQDAVATGAAVASSAVSRAASLATDPAQVRDAGRTAQTETGMLLKLGFGLRPQDNALRGPLGRAKSVAWTDPVPLDEVKQVGRAVGGTVNDVMLGIVAGALRRYVQRSGGDVDDAVRAVVPYNLRPADEPLPVGLGNRFGLVFVDLPVGLAEPTERIAAVSQQMQTIKSSREGAVVFGGLQVMGNAPATLAQDFLDLYAARASAVITNIAGPKEQLCFVGSPLDGFVLWVPTSGSIAVGLSIVSYRGGVTLGVAVDAQVVPDSEALLHDLSAETDEVRASLL